LLRQIPGLEVWFQRASDVVRKLRLGDIDLGIVGTDMYEVGVHLLSLHTTVVKTHMLLHEGATSRGVPTVMHGHVLRKRMVWGMTVCN
jgi:ATP phosphoribosyltransferase